MRFSVRDNWVHAVELIASKPIILLPFTIIAFIEGLFLQLVYFAPRKPLLYLTGPIIKKFFGEAALHYPGHLLSIPRMFYYGQVATYVLLGVLMYAVSVNIVRNVKAGFPVNTRVILRNSISRYASFLVFGIVTAVLLSSLKILDVKVFSKIVNLLGSRIPRGAIKLFPFALSTFVFLTNTVVNTFLTCTIPLIILRKSSFAKAIIGSIFLGTRHFFTLFLIIAVPYLTYLPIILLKSAPGILANRAFPEINVVISALGIVLTMIIECFILVSVTQFVMFKDKGKKKPAAK